METKQTEEVILRAAEKLFMEQGFKETTTAQIAKVAGCNSALVHYYFRTKENLFAKIFSSKVEEYTNALFVGLEHIDSLEELVRYAVEAHWDFMAEHSDLALFLLKEILSMSDRTRFFIERHSELRDKTAEKVEQLKAREAERGHIYSSISGKELLQLTLALDAGYFYPLVIRAKAFGEELNPEEVALHREEVIKNILARLNSPD